MVVLVLPWPYTHICFVICALFRSGFVYLKRRRKYLHARHSFGFWFFSQFSGAFTQKKQIIRTHFNSFVVIAIMRLDSGFSVCSRCDSLSISPCSCSNTLPSFMCPFFFFVCLYFCMLYSAHFIGGLSSYASKNEWSMCLFVCVFYSTPCILCYIWRDKPWNIPFEFVFLANGKKRANMKSKCQQTRKKKEKKTHRKRNWYEERPWSSKNATNLIMCALTKQNRRPQPTSGAQIINYNKPVSLFSRNPFNRRRKMIFPLFFLFFVFFFAFIEI